MPLFRLTPVDVPAFASGSNLWRQTAGVRAPDEAKARRTASIAFYTAIVLPSRERTFRSSPWENPAHTRP